MAQHPHIADEDLLMALDGELGPARRAEVEAHLEQCWTCRARRTELEAAIARFVRHRSQHPRPQWGVALATLALAAALAAAGYFGMREPRYPLPDARLTPGATREFSRESACRVEPQDEGRLVRAEMASRVFQRYRIATPKARAYEVDYLISPALGGAEDIRNLWPVPYDEGVWTSRVKDALEDHLRRLVCDGKLALTAAQEELASDWISAYQRHFRSRQPLKAHALFVKDSPWE